MAEGHDFDEAIFGQPTALFHHVIEHHCDLSDRSADVHKAEKEEVEKNLAPGWHLMIRRQIALLSICHNLSRL
jgi:hypothetical protein